MLLKGRTCQDRTDGLQLEGLLTLTFVLLGRLLSLALPDPGLHDMNLPDPPLFVNPVCLRLIARHRDLGDPQHFILGIQGQA